MPILTPNSFGTILPTRLREYNPYHEPAGTPQGGQFAAKPGGSAPKPKIGTVEIGKWDPDAARQVLGRTLSKAGAKALAEEMVADVDGITFNVRVKAEMLVEYDEATGRRSQKPAIVIRWIGDDGDPNASNPEDQPTSMVRALSRGEHGALVAKHTAFEKNRKQPAGVGKDVLRSHMRAYERLGVDRIETYANIDVGAYAWAKYGFVASDPAQIRNLIDDATGAAWGMTIHNRDFVTGQAKGRGVGLGENEVRMLRAIGASNSKTAIWEFADATIDGVKVGKELLATTDGWDAYFTVKEDGSALTRRMHERFWNYVGRTKGERKREAKALGPGLAGLLYLDELGEAQRPRTTSGEMCEWMGSRYGDRRLWAAMLNGDSQFFYNLRSPSERAAYRGLLPRG